MTRRKASLPTLKRKLDTLFSKYVRMSESNPAGFATCVTCGKRDLFTRMDCGHFIPRGSLATRWDERNCHVQCQYCNRFRVDAYVDYTLWMLSHYGPEVVEELQALKGKPVKLTRFDLEARIDEVAGKLATLAMGYVNEPAGRQYALESLS